MKVLEFERSKQPRSNLYAYFVSLRSINVNQLEPVFNRFKNVCIIFTANHQFAYIRIAIYDPFDQVLNVICCSVNLVKNHY